MTPEGKSGQYIIPKEVSQITNTLKMANFEAFLVGGCTRDLILDRKPRDWDITTNATPEEIIRLFPKTYYENNFGTVGVVNEESEDPTVKIVEVTPYRLESAYTDFRRPDKVNFSKSIEDDLKRRDFTINAIALDISTDLKDNSVKIIDLYKGQSDISDKIIRTVGNPDDRFTEDALRIMRAVRLSTELGFTINKETADSIFKNAHLLDKIAKERIRDEFNKILMSKEPMIGLIMAQKLGILKYIAPELEKCIGIEQNQAHSYDVWEHLLRSLQHSADRDWPLEIRLSALFHDISKPETRRFSRETNQFTFYGHEVVGSRVTKKILESLRYPKKTIEKVVTLVRWHMFFTDTEQITLSAVRRMVSNVGKDNIWDLMNVRVCDRIGTGRPKENPYRLRKYKAMIEEAMRDPISVGMLKIDGKRIMDVSHETPGPKIGLVLHALLEEVIENPKLNLPEYLEKRSLEFIKMPISELSKLGKKGKDRKEAEEIANIEEIRSKYKVN
jgi:tRNA nucleotidyltransferase (CCA-adding enzyme)